MKGERQGVGEKLQAGVGGVKEGRGRILAENGRLGRRGKRVKAVGGPGGVVSVADVDGEERRQHLTLVMTSSPLITFLRSPVLFL